MRDEIVRVCIRLLKITWKFATYISNENPSLKF